MKGFYSLVQALSAIGVIVSLIICMFIPPIGIIALIANICAISAQAKKLRT